MFELYEYDEVGDGHWDGAGERCPVHREQPVPRDGLQVLDIPDQLFDRPPVIPVLEVLSSTSQLSEAGMKVMNCEEYGFHPQKEPNAEQYKPKHHNQ